ncbi:hypothetical protein [Pseudarthrobacter sp. 1C304]|uniref:hypothetical protein n=1 Tax=Pseudarthrobacter sp. 1C304 TaxID=3457438 RepID=UPI003FD31946
MEPTPSPTPVEVFVHTGPAEWWEVLAALGPLAVLLGALIAGVVGWRTLQQKAEADNRSEWWKRAQWALDAVHSGDKQRGAVGLKVLTVLGESELAGDGELAVLHAATERPLGQAAQQARHGAQAVPSGPGQFDDDDRAIHIAAAQLREVTDRRLGRPTPAWIRALGQEQP